MCVCGIRLMSVLGGILIYLFSSGGWNKDSAHLDKCSSLVPHILPALSFKLGQAGSPALNQADLTPLCFHQECLGSAPQSMEV